VWNFWAENVAKVYQLPNILTALGTIRFGMTGQTPQSGHGAFSATHSLNGIYPKEQHMNSKMTIWATAITLSLGGLAQTNLSWAEDRCENAIVLSLYAFKENGEKAANSRTPAGRSEILKVLKKNKDRARVVKAMIDLRNNPEVCKAALELKKYGHSLGFYADLDHVNSGTSFKATVDGEAKLIEESSNIADMSEFILLHFDYQMKINKQAHELQDKNRKALEEDEMLRKNLQEFGAVPSRAGNPDQITASTRKEKTDVPQPGDMICAEPPSSSSAWASAGS
jgi:hypothetical protein